MPDDDAVSHGTRGIADFDVGDAEQHDIGPGGVGAAAERPGDVVSSPAKGCAQRLAQATATHNGQAQAGPIPRG
jgi:hypothetical protein